MAEEISLRTKETILSDFKELQKVFNENPNIAKLISQIFENTINDKINSTTYPNLRTTLRMLVGNSSTRLILGCCRDNDLEYPKIIEESLLEKNDIVLGFLNSLVILYGNKTDKASRFHYYPEYAETISFTVLNAPNEKNWFSEIKIMRTDNQKFFSYILPNHSCAVIAAMLSDMIKMPKEEINPKIVVEIEKNFHKFIKKFGNKNKGK
jgi:hypothetical protein